MVGLIKYADLKRMQIDYAGINATFAHSESHYDLLGKTYAAIEDTILVVVNIHAGSNTLAL